ASDQGAAVVFAGGGNSLDDFFGDFRLELASCQVIHKKQGSCALDGNVIDAMIDQIGADGSVDVHLEGDFELGAHTVHAGNQHGIQVFCLIHREQSAKTANLAKNPFGE